MKLLYLCLSPTFGMHQYTADLANRMAAAGHEVTLVGTSHLPCDRYSPTVRLVTPLSNRSTGFSSDGLRLDLYRKLCYTVTEVDADVVHVTSPHLWTPWLLRSLASAGGPPTVHTLHDLDPHVGRRFGRLIRTWNLLVIRHAGHLLVHGRHYYDRLLAQGVDPARLTYTPLLHLCFSHATEMRLQVEGSTFNVQPSPLAATLGDLPPLSPPATLGDHGGSPLPATLGDHGGSPLPSLSPLPTPHPSPLTSLSSDPFALFLGRLEAYKGLGVLIAAASHLPAGCCRVIVAGPGRLDPPRFVPLPVKVELRNRLIEDAEALDLLRSCSLVVLPYLSGTQSALIAVAYYFGKPVIVTRTGALPEYVVEGVTGWVIPPGDPAPLAACLCEALADPARLQVMGAAGREWRQRERRSEAATLAQMYDTLAVANDP